MASKDDLEFEGFKKPDQNWFRMPNIWTDLSRNMTSIAEMKIIEYILRHTWGFQEFGIVKHITLDEFINGRWKNKDERWDHGTGLSENSIRTGIRLALAHNLIIQEEDRRDLGRVKHLYALKMRLNLPPQTLRPTPSNNDPRGAKPAPRTNRKKETFKKTEDIYTNDDEMAEKIRQSVERLNGPDGIPYLDFTKDADP